MKAGQLIITILILTSISACSRTSQNEESNKIQIFTSILPQKFFVDKIGGERVETTSLVGPGKSPTTYQPTPKQIVKLSRANVLFTIGVPFEKAYLRKTTSTLDSLLVIDCSSNIEKREIGNHHDHDEEEHSEIENLDPHVWLSPVLAQIIAKDILDTLISIDPDGKTYYTEKFNKLISELENIDIELHGILDSLKGQSVFVYHPSFGYFLDEFGMEQEAVETGGKTPTPGQLERMIKEAKNDGVKIIIVQPEFSKKSAEIIATAIEGTVTTLNPLEYDYINNLRNMANIIYNSYK